MGSDWGNGAGTFTWEKRMKNQRIDKSKVSKVMDEWKAGTLRSGSAQGPKVTNQKQAVAIALSEARKGK